MRNIRPRFHLMSVLLLLLAAVPVHAEDYGWFELDLPPGWRAEEPRQLSGTWVLRLRNDEAGSQVSLLVGKTVGPPDAADVAGLLRAATGVREPARRRNGRWLFTGKDGQGVDTACIVSTDHEAGLYLAVLRSGCSAPAEALLAGLRSKKYPGLLPH
ncbi:MAG: hypothetical protein LUG19_01520 [Desulfovibrio sp.]|uniref:hypothetical protein n=1 Tax=Desulfovibrio sp. TaxID=885 RepID=UPI002585A44A|nr:hypothetical protein [Desulfovibrio sp.]MCD7982918.1 hypothetical protein [Desulfovibrio sp.]